MHVAIFQVQRQELMYETDVCFYMKQFTLQYVTCFECNLLVKLVLQFVVPYM